MAIKETLQIGDPILKRRNKEIKNFSDPRIKKVIKDLKDTMLNGTLIGIAAPQIGENYKIFLTMPRKTKFRKLPFKDILRVYVNPVLVKASKEKIVIWEGCGCVGQTDMFFGPVTRPKEITLEAFDEKGKKFRIRCNGILARVIQHEVDHLNGVEFLEKVDDYRKLMHQTHYTKTVRNSPEAQKAAKVNILEVKNLN
jgi:peptide deformylase